MIGKHVDFMNEDILIDITPQETRVAMVFQGKVREIHIEHTVSRSLIGNIYIGKVIRILPSMRSAFIDIGLERAGFLHVDDVWENYSKDGYVKKSVPIEKIFFNGQCLTVQVVKDSIGQKGVGLSTKISIIGRTLVYSPQGCQIRASKRIVKEANRNILISKLKNLFLPKGGFVIRTMAEHVSEIDLKIDIENLSNIWASISTSSKKKKEPTLIYQGFSLSQRTLRDFSKKENNNIQINSYENFQTLQEFSDIYTPSVSDRLIYSKQSLFDLYEVDKEIQEALSRRVPLKSGGYLIFDQTEAMTTIDVNTGSFVKSHSSGEIIFRTNLEASEVIALQIRLRNLGGIIIVDFIDMNNTEHRKSVLAKLNKNLEYDRNMKLVSGFSALGLIEITRKRTRDSLARTLCEMCTACGGKGQIKHARAICYDIFREIMRKEMVPKLRELRILAAQGVINMLLSEESQYLSTLKEFIQKEISLQVEKTYRKDQYNIILI